MHLLDQRILGIAILILLAALVAVKLKATGSIVEPPKGGLLLQLVNIFNLFFLLIVNPVAAVLLIARSLAALDVTRLSLGTPWVFLIIEVVGILLYVKGFALMVWALLRLGSNYQLGGSTPRPADKMVTDGPYRFIRHPMYTAALAISSGLALFTQSLAFFAVFCIYLVLILLLIPAEERELQKAYGAQYVAYRKRSGALIPFIN